MAERVKPRGRVSRPLNVVEDPVTALWQVTIRTYRSGRVQAMWSRMDTGTRRLVTVGLSDPQPTLYGAVQLPEALLGAAQEVVHIVHSEDGLPS